MFISAFVIYPNLINANSSCDYNEQAALINEAANIKVSYEEAEMNLGQGLPNDSGEIAQIKQEYFKISIYNLSEKFYVKVENDYNDDVRYFNYANTEGGVVSFDWMDLDTVVNYTITVYSSNMTNCSNEEYRIIYLTTPRINDFADSAKCTDNEGFYLCQKYITETEEIDYEKFNSELTKFESKTKDEIEEGQEKSKSWKDEVSEFINNNKLPIGIGATIVVVGGVVTTVIVIKKRRSRLI